ncbi:MAG: hypothetical protein IPI67_14765 [Myxococcales bacterium]|nr:hypothetical protein [Myxococcales bacterium]
MATCPHAPRADANASEQPHLDAFRIAHRFHVGAAARDWQATKVALPDPVEQAGVPECFGQNAELDVVRLLELEEVNREPIRRHCPEIDLAGAAGAPATAIADCPVEYADRQLTPETLNAFDGCKLFNELRQRRERALESALAAGLDVFSTHPLAGLAVHERIFGPRNLQSGGARESPRKETNAAWQTVPINDTELRGFAQRALDFTRR